MSIPRFLLPRGEVYLRDVHLCNRLLATTTRRYATAPPPKPRVLAKPERFNPPSHSSRPRKTRQYPGAPLSDHERQAQTVRKYPHMMPPEGSFMHWFLTNRSIHLYITLSVLISLTFLTWFTNFINTTPYGDLLPPNNMFFAHPIQFIRRYVEVYDMHLAYVSAQTAERRKQKVDDVSKRSEYRKAHGIDQGEGIFGGWTAKTDEESMGPALREGGAASLQEGGGSVALPVADDASPTATGEDSSVYADFEGNKRPARKWLGIW